MKKGKSYKSLYLPAWSIVAAVLTLLLVIVVSTYRNMSRERGRMEASLIREGLVIIRAIEAGVRADVSSATPDAKRLQKLVEEVSREPEVAAIMIFDHKGDIVAMSHTAEPVPEKIKGAPSLALLLKDRGMITRYPEPPGGVPVFEIIQPFRPFSYPIAPSLRRAVESESPSQETPSRRWAGDKMIALSLHQATFETARREDRHHTLLMGAILIVLGIGALYFIFIVQNYYRVDRSLRRSERLASLGRLAAGVAHEIRNPLSSIRGFAQYFVKRFHGQPEEEGYALVMVKEVDRLNRVITELLDFAGPKEPRREPNSLEDIADHALKLLAPDLAARKVEVFREYEPGLPAVSIDRDQISQVFLNLLLNAIESMEGGGELRITLRRSGPPPAVLTSITDTGGGIPADDLEKVFEPFFSRKRKGTGLGLAIVHQIVESHRGEIRAESGPGKGTIFRMTLPVESGRKSRHRDG